MNIDEHDKIDRGGWPAGAWDREPDRLEWRDESTGLPCLIVRQTSGALCGYVAVPPGHPFHGVGYENDYDYDYDCKCTASPVGALDVHGGVTYTEKCGGHVCHVPAPGEPDDVWWIGFDCAHSGDTYPHHEKYSYRLRGEVYCTVDYVRAECASLAAQIAAATTATHAATAAKGG